MTDVRCGNKKHGELHDGVLEVKCDSKFCGADGNTVVIHRYRLMEDDEVYDAGTRKFREPQSRKEK